MNLNDNPIFLTQKRLVHRGGVLAAILIAALIGFSLLSGLIAYSAEPRNFDFHSSQEAGKTFYAWVLAIEILILTFGGFARISQTLANERKAGLWDSNRLTPLKPGQLIMGYWFGSPLREFYMGAVLGAIGLVIVLGAGLPITLWFGTQILVASSALLFGLLGVLMGLAFSRPQGMLVLLAAFFLLPFSFAAPAYLLTNFLLPFFGIIHLFYVGINPVNDYPEQQWESMPHVFGVPVPAILLTLALQSAVGLFFWRAAWRKAANPFQSPLFRWEAVTLFAILVITQHGLLWGLWSGNFRTAAQSFNDSVNYGFMLPIVHCGTMLLGVIILVFASPNPEHVRVEAMRFGFKNPSAIFRRSAVPLALILAAVGMVGLLTECIFSIADSWKPLALAFGNLLSCFLIFSLLLEFCRLRFKRRALGFVALWLFVICILPFILAGVFSNTAIGWFSLFSPGFMALAETYSERLNYSDQLIYLPGAVAVHFGIVVLLFLLWRREWLKLLAKTSASQK